MDNEAKNKIFLLQKEKKLQHKNFIIRAFVIFLFLDMDSFSLQPSGAIAKL